MSLSKMPQNLGINHATPHDLKEEGSFRDRNGQVFYCQGEVFRGISEKALRNWRDLRETDFYAAGCAAGHLTDTKEIDPLSKNLPLQQSEKWVAVLQHKPIPFVSYPYEWSFHMLRDAAMLQLQLLQEALAENMTLKDASSFNIQWRGSQPVFIDIPSFEPWKPGEPWVGYRQFCQLFLYPLMLQAYKNIPFHPWLRGSIDGLEPENFSRLISWRDLLRPGVFVHVNLHARLQHTFEKSTRSVKKQLQSSGFAKELILANVTKLKKLICKMAWSEKIDLG